MLLDEDRSYKYFLTKAWVTVHTITFILYIFSFEWTAMIFWYASIPVFLGDERDEDDIPESRRDVGFDEWDIKRDMEDEDEEDFGEFDDNEYTQDFFGASEQAEMEEMIRIEMEKGQDLDLSKVLNLNFPFSQLEDLIFAGHAVGRERQLLDSKSKRAIRFKKTILRLAKENYFSFIPVEKYLDIMDRSGANIISKNESILDKAQFKVKWDNILTKQKAWNREKELAGEKKKWDFVDAEREAQKNARELKRVYINSGLYNNTDVDYCEFFRERVLQKKLLLFNSSFKEDLNDYSFNQQCIPKAKLKILKKSLKTRTNDLFNKQL